MIDDCLKAFLCGYGGIVPSEDVFYPEALAVEALPKGDYFFDGFFGSDISDEYNRFREFIPFGYIPLTMDSFGGLLLTKADVTVSPIFYCDHEDLSSTDGDRNLRVYKIADSIMNFICCLRVDRERPTTNEVKVISIDNDLL